MSAPNPFATPDARADAARPAPAAVRVFVRWRPAVIAFAAAGFVLAALMTAWAQPPSEAPGVFLAFCAYFGGIGGTLVAAGWVLLRRRGWHALIAGPLAGVVGGAAGAVPFALVMYLGMLDTSLIGERSTDAGRHLFSLLLAAVTLGLHAFAYGVAGVLVGPALVWYERREDG